MVSFDEFKKLDLSVGRVVNVEEVEGLDNLYKLTIELGSSRQRVILAGLKKTHQPYEILGKLVVVLANLEHREIKGVKSEGMLLAADSAGKPVLITPEEEVDPGCKVR